MLSKFLFDNYLTFGSKKKWWKK